MKVYVAILSPVRARDNGGMPLGRADLEAPSSGSLYARQPNKSPRAAWVMAATPGCVMRRSTDMA